MDAAARIRLKPNRSPIISRIRVDIGPYWPKQRLAVSTNTTAAGHSTLAGLGFGHHSLMWALAISRSDGRR
jgi:hypothetical protein